MSTKSQQADLGLREIVGKTVLVGLTWVDQSGEILEQEQLSGKVESLDGGLVHIRVDGSGEDFTLPPDAEAFTEAAAGNYRLRGTGKVVVNPDLISSWSICRGGADSI